MKNDALIEKNNELREQLNPENRKFYSDFMGYVRSQNLDRDENQLESQLLNILQDTIDAQNDGISAADYFGKNPKELGDEIIQNLPRNFKDVLKLILVCAASFIFFSLFPSLIDPKTSFDLGSALIAGTYATITIFAGYKLAGKTIYNSWFMKMNKRLKYAIIFGLAAVLWVVGVVLLDVVKTPLKVTLSGWAGIVTILVLDVIALVLYIRTNHKDLYTPFVPLVAIFSLLGILTRIPTFGDFLLKKAGGSTLLVLTIALAVFITWLWSNKRLSKGEAQEK
ncbi:hypothetical protein PUF88_02415 [Lactobacillaceae bacterium L1_55_11]|nr:hypothetical protein [Lactobacillaceae bacterium L1_55_11]